MCLFTKTVSLCFSIFFILFLGGGCATAPSLQKNDVIAIWDLENLTATDDYHIEMGEILSSRIIETVREMNAYNLVEREKLLVTLKELQLSSTTLVDENSRLQVGKLLGARFMVFGGYQVIEDLIRIDLRVIEVETGQFFKADSEIVESTELALLMDAVEKLTKKLFVPVHP